MNGFSKKFKSFSNSHQFLRDEKILPKGFVTPKKATEHAQMLSNRIRKRFRHLSRRFKREGIDCFRLYDWDIKEVRAVVDWYAGHVVIGEYVRLQTGEDWLPRMAEAVAGALKIPLSHVHMRRRQTNVKEGPRYPKSFQVSKSKCFEVRERDLCFLVNMEDYLDTGLFSDHRDTRVIVRDLAQGKDFLNLFAYTGSFTCAAAAGGARSTVTVDRSENYLKWAEDNLRLNNLSGPRHKFIQSDAGIFLERSARERVKFSLAFVDPPSFFQDRSRNASFDVNLDHPELILKVLKVMSPGATVFFSTNHQRFEPHLEGLPVKDLIELTPKTIPEDYRNRKVHRLWRMNVV